MGLKDCTITLDNTHNTYYPGQTINGNVEYTFDSPKKVRGIRIKIKGVCETKWTESHRKHVDGKTRVTKIHYTGLEEYFTIAFYLEGSNKGNEVELPEGTHNYPFTCVLPPVLPTSFEGEYGFVRYTIKVTLDRPWKFDQDTKMAFSVISDFDLNLHSEYRAPFNMNIEDTFCSCWCAISGALEVDVYLPVSAFCPGQLMPFDINCKNASDVDVNDIKVELIKIIKYRSRTPRSKEREEKIVIAELTLDSVDHNSSKQLRGSLQVPPVPPTDLTHCNLIDVLYEIKVECSTSGCHFSADEKAPIIIGTIPFIDLPFAPLAPLPVMAENQEQIQYQSGPSAPFLPTAPQETPDIKFDSIIPPIPPAGANYVPPAGGNFSPYPYSGGSPAPYPAGNTAPYPTGSPTAYPGGNAPPYPGGNAPPYPGGYMPPPGGNNMPYMCPPPTYEESQFTAKSINDSDDHEDTMICGNPNFAPRYPVYGFITPFQQK